MDAKLAKQVKPEFLLQVCGYSWMLEEYQDSIPQKDGFSWKSASRVLNYSSITSFL